MESLLPLRLSVEPYLKKIISNCFILPSIKENQICLIVSSFGLSAITTNILYDTEHILFILDINIDDLPQYCFIYSTKKWINLRDINNINIQINKMILEKSSISNPKVAKIIVDSIHRYYSLQVLEPSIKGFLSILEKQFPRNDLYLFELLQNAVDDGAMKVCFDSKKDERFNIIGLDFNHDGRQFNAMDVLGLSSVGLSTKSSIDGEPKRTIGFMGVGFKAVYKRFGKVTIYDHNWSFCFEEPKIKSEMEPSHGWVLKPKWVGNINNLWDNKDSSTTKNWCHFQLELPRGGGITISKDLNILAKTIPALLGRQAIKNEKIRVETPIGEWNLQWDLTLYNVTKSIETINLYESKSRNYWCAQSENIIVNKKYNRSKSPTETVSWLFLSVHFIPSTAALEAYLLHTKRDWNSGDKNSTEETSIFFELDANGNPIISKYGGNVHAILPTKLKLPSSIQWQGTWLLSVDRQEIQNLNDNEWNKCILLQSSRLFSALLLWICTAFTLNPKLNISLMYKLLPPMEICEKGNLSSNLLGQNIPMDDLIDTLKYEKVIPVYSSIVSNEKTILDNSSSIDKILMFKSSKDAIWLPPSFIEFIPLDLLKVWFISAPICTTLLGDSLFLPMWKISVQRPTLQLINERKKVISSSIVSIANLIKNSEEYYSFYINILVAFGEACILNPPINDDKSSLSSTSSNKKNTNHPTKSNVDDIDNICSDWLPGLRHWPIFLIESGLLVCSNEIGWANDDFNILPAAIRKFLRQGIILAIESTRQIHNNRKHHSPPPPIYLLSESIEEMLKVNSNTSNLHAQYCCKIARELNPNHVISVEMAAKSLFQSFANKIFSIESSKDIIQLFNWCMKENRFELITHILVDVKDNFKTSLSEDDRKLKLVNIQTSYIGFAYNGKEGQDFECLLDSLGNSNLTVSSIYLPISKDTNMSNDIVHKKYVDFLINCGALNKPSLIGITRNITSHEIKLLDGQVLPKCRSSNTSNTLHLPYELGIMNKNTQIIVDCNFSKDWINIFPLKNVNNAKIFANLVTNIFLNLDISEKSTPESTPSSAACLKGLSVENINNNIKNNCIPVNSPLPALAKLYHLPPGQAGASAISIGIASWLQVLATSKWIPAIAPGGTASDGPTLVLSPSEVLLPFNSDSRDLVSLKTGRVQLNSTTVSEMPIACLPNSLINLLTTSSSTYFSSILSNTFKWGSIKPSPPIDRLEELSIFLNKEEESDKLFTIVGGDYSYPNNHVYSELVSLWRSIAIAHSDKRLSLKDCNRVSRLVLIKNTKIIPGFGKLWNIYQCLKINSGSKFNSTSNESDEELAAIYFLRVGACLNINENTIYGENNMSWELANVSNSMISIIKPQSCVSSNLAKDYLNWFCNKDLILAPSNSIKKAYTFALWVVCKSNLPDNGINPSSLSPEALKLCYHSIKQLCPNLKVFCKRMGMKKEIWLPVFESNDLDIFTDKIQHSYPVLIDDENITSGSGIIRSSLLRPDHNYQAIDMLNSDYISNQLSFMENIDMKRLICIEKNLIKILQVPKISDSKLFQLKISASPNGEYLEKVSERLDIIIQLLRIIHFNPLQSNVVFDDKISLPISTEKIILQRHLTLNCQFKTPLMSTFEIKPTFAIWGTKNHAAIQLSEINNDEKCKIKIMLLSGEVDDYNNEMEELVKRHVFNNNSNKTQKSTVIFDVKKSLLALKLLNYIEDEEIFMKHLHRNFDDFTKPVPENLPNENIDISSIEIAEMIRNLYEFIKKIEEKSNQLDSLKKETETIQNITDELPVVELISNERMNKKGLSNLPAWMTSGIDPNIDEKTVAEIARNNNIIQDNNISKTNIESRVSIESDSSNLPSKKRNKEEMQNEFPAVELISNERMNKKGLSNLPAWMTSGIDPNIDEKPVAEILLKGTSIIKDNMKTAELFLNSLDLTSLSTVSIQKNTIDDNNSEEAFAKNSEFYGKGKKIFEMMGYVEGTGLGRDNDGEVNNITLETTKLKEGVGYDSTQLKKRNKEEMQNELPVAELISNERMDKKGLSNLPAWMTSGIDPIENNSITDCTDNNKRRKTHEGQFQPISNLLLSLIIDSSSKNLSQILFEIDLIKNVILESVNDDKLIENLKTEKLKSSLTLIIDTILDKEDNSHPYRSLLN